MPAFDLQSLLVIFTALALGGMVKGATGAGAPVLAVPVIATFFDVPLAVAVMVMPNFFTNLWQLWRFSDNRLRGGFTLRFGLAGAIGAVVGTVMLASLPEKALTLITALAVVAYVGLRLAHPDFKLIDAAVRRGVLPAGFAAGALQGAAGISAPVAISFLNAMRLTRPVFIATISAFFLIMSAVQMPALFVAGILTADIFLLSVFALVPLLAFMPVGGWLARHMSAEAFDRLMLFMLTGLALRLFYTVFF